MRKTARAVIIYKNKLIAIHRKKVINQILYDYYVLPGGGVEENETLHQTVVREMKEELGIGVKVIEELFVVNDDHFLYCLYEDGVLGTGEAEEFNDKENGQYLIELIPISLIDKIDELKPETLKDNLVSWLVNNYLP